MQSTRKVQVHVDFDRASRSLSRRGPARYLIAAWVSMGVCLMSAQESHAAGFMDNSLANFSNIKSLPDSWKDMVKAIGAVSYLIPIVVIVGCAAAQFIATNHSEAASSKTKVACLSIILFMFMMWIYDTTMVGKV